MATSSANLFVSSTDHASVIKINGRASFSSSAHFMMVVDQLHERGARRFILDLTECATMDSTFLGVLAGLAMKLSDGNGEANRPVLELVRPNERVLDLLENLGIAHFFARLDQSPIADVSLAPSTPQDTTSKDDLSKICLEAHQTLMAVNPENVPKFKDVAAFLADELKKPKS